MTVSKGVLLPVVAPMSEGRVDAALRGVGVAADGMYLGCNGNVRALVAGCQRGP